MPRRSRQPYRLKGIIGYKIVGREPFMETIEATYRVVTPMFCSGADQSKAELRLPSIKGALRFWWRALAWEGFNRTWPELVGNISKIRQAEAKLFGSAEVDIGQAAVLMKLEAEEPPQPPPNFQGLPGAIYLGYGVMNFKGELQRKPLSEGFEFKLSLLLKQNVSSKEHTSIVHSLRALGLFGALGSKSRKGYGSLMLVRLDSGDAQAWSSPHNVEQFKSATRGLIGSPSQSSLPDYTAFSKQSRVYVAMQDSDPLELLNAVGEAMQLYRGWGRHGKVNGQPAKRNFTSDHDNMAAAANGRNFSAHPERIVFGLPHNYFFSSTKAKVDVSAASRSVDRRASPLFIKIHEFSNNNYAAVLTLLPARFLPQGEQILVKSRAGSYRFDPSVDYEVIHRFASTKYFPAITMVLP
jgi:CRISPR-associated protein Cmr1